MSSSNKVSRSAALLFGSLAALAIPVGGALSVFLQSVTILKALAFAVAAGVIFGIIGASAARRARFKVERSVARRGERTVRTARFLVYTGLYLAVCGGIALGFYEALRSRH